MKLEDIFQTLNDKWTGKKLNIQSFMGANNSVSYAQGVYPA
jgi:hypothetical protein